MLKKFSVQGFKGFKDRFVFELDKTKGYNFNTECIKTEIVNNAIIYGKNAVGKSNLGIAIFDIVSHITDNQRDPELYRNYLNAENDLDYASFDYLFEFNGIEISYKYEKRNIDKIVKESLSIDGTEVVFYDRSSNKVLVRFEGTENLSTEIPDGLSLVKYVKSNSSLGENKINNAFKSFLSFVDKMLFFRSLNDTVYLGLEFGTKDIAQDIIEKKHVGELQNFLCEAGVECNLKFKKESNQNVIVFDYGEGKEINLFHIASSGTRALTIFYFWLQRLKQESSVSFLFIDEFDAFYHHELSKFIVDKLKEVGIQFVLTTHNTSIMTNDILRPDCYFVMNSQMIKSLPNLTDKELREAHNLSKIYSAGGFDVR